MPTTTTPTHRRGRRRHPESSRTRGFPAVLAWALWVLVLLGLAVALWLDHLLRQAGRPDLVSTDADAVPYVLALVSAATVGAVVASRRPRHPVGWLLLGLGLSVIALGTSDAYAAYGLLARPGSLPAARWAAVYVDVSWAAVSTLLGFILLLTPTGSLPSPGWRWWSRFVMAAAAVSLTLSTDPMDPPYEAVANPLMVRSGPLVAVARLADIITLVGVLVAAGSLVVRFRRSRGTERLQLRWVALAAALAGVAVAFILVSWAAGGEAAQPLWGWVTGIYVAILPLATGAAILRYRLYDLDRIISRTLAYAALTVLLGLGYAGVVLLLSRLLPDSSSLTVAGATLAVAAVFQPARRRVQAAVDRRFNRRRYDAARTIQAFSARLRQQIDLDTLTDELVAVTEQTMQPTRVSLWLRARP
ncbi:MAG TPA: hypothetical protein VK942_11535 [Actinomycetes bacterium]|nr:hypothetical protein [Actinomycetes bacterium]